MRWMKGIWTPESGEKSHTIDYCADPERSSRSYYPYL